MPSILLELGFLSNKEDEKLLVDPVWRKKVADRLGRAPYGAIAASGGRATAADALLYDTFDVICVAGVTAISIFKGMPCA